MLPQTRLVARRSYSIAARVRSLAQNNPMLHHIQGYPASQQGAKADWGYQLNHVRNTAML